MFSKKKSTNFGFDVFFLIFVFVRIQNSAYANLRRFGVVDNLFSLAQNNAEIVILGKILVVKRNTVRLGGEHLLCRGDLVIIFTSEIDRKKIEK